MWGVWGGGECMCVCVWGGGGFLFFVLVTGCCTLSLCFFEIRKHLFICLGREKR